ncbi:MAG: TetR/AcrR family transcriptional regulator [Lachnospiraceae bacterium]|nr:TetR/AcrR family transcriptional regulator [Lachnospiraceae bacterium]
MPKVTEEYITKKKRLIVDTAYELCIEKTVSTVTMQDIINRTGLSQGGVYRFYHDIDEIFSDMLIEMRKRVDVKDRVDVIFAQVDELSVTEITTNIFDMLANFMEEELMGILKIDFEMSVLAMNAPHRVEKILGGAKGIGHMEYLMLRTGEIFKKKMENERLQARVGEVELLTYISSAYTGIQMNCIVNRCYQSGAMAQFYQPRVLLQTMAKTVNYLLGIE